MFQIRLSSQSHTRNISELSSVCLRAYFPLSTANVTYEFCPKASQEQQRSTAEGRSILGDLASLNFKSVGGVEDDETEEEGESVVVDSGGIDVSLGKARRVWSYSGTEM